MQSDIRNYQNAEGLTDEEMARLLSARLDREISTTGYRIVKGRKDAPEEWLRALNIAPTDEPTSGAVSNATTPDAPPRDHAATSSAGAPISLPFEPASARMQITLVYTMAGKGVALPTRRIGTPDALVRANRIENAWATAAPSIADAYIEWAKENSTVAHYIGMLTLGGAGGKLMLLHASLLIQTLIESGAVKPEQFLPSAFRTPEETDTISEGEPLDDFPEPEPAPDDGPRTRRPRAKRA